MAHGNQLPNGRGPHEAATGEILSTLVYRSRAVRRLSPSELYDLSADAHRRNGRESITGLMVYDDTRFFQWIEGPCDNIGRLMHSIRNDRRHTDIEVLATKTTRQRKFGNWGMKLASCVNSDIPWREDILALPTAIIDQLRLRPDAAPAVLVKLVPGAARETGTAPLAAWNPAPLGRTTAALLKAVLLTDVIPILARQHRTPDADVVTRLPISARVSELADLLISSDQEASRQLIEEIFAAEGSAWPLYPALFEIAARHLGDLWAEDHCSEFDVTLGLCRIQSAARLLNAHAVPTFDANLATKAILVAPEPGEIHTLSAILDSEVLWHAGWGTRCEFATDTHALLDRVSGTWFDALDISLSSAFTREHALTRLAKTIAEARRASRNPELLVVAGGRAFTEGNATRLQVGADLVTKTALDVNELIRLGVADRIGGPGN